MTNPHVIICGGGPSGLLTSILLHKIGVRSTVLEKAREADEWSSKSYTIVLGERGCGALDKAGLMDAVKEAGRLLCFQ
jgi:2-polyprenyl-6-methoxyphenol hydroxylase-like FAD-dependent oxidoreductase